MKFSLLVRLTGQTTVQVTVQVDSLLYNSFYIQYLN